MPFDVVSCSSPSAGSFADSLTFSYTVSPGDYSSDLSYTDTGALSLLVTVSANDSESTTSTTEIVDESGNDVNVTLPAVGSELSVTGGEEWQRLEAEEGEGGGALVVDTSNVVLYVTATNGDGVYYTGESIFVQVNPCFVHFQQAWWISTLLRAKRVGHVGSIPSWNGALYGNKRSHSFHRGG